MTPDLAVWLIGAIVILIILLLASGDPDDWMSL